MEILRSNEKSTLQGSAMIFGWQGYGLWSSTWVDQDRLILRSVALVSYSLKAVTKNR